MYSFPSSVVLANDISFSITSTIPRFLRSSINDDTDDVGSWVISASFSIDNSLCSLTKILSIVCSPFDKGSVIETIVHPPTAESINIFSDLYKDYALRTIIFTTKK